jgi:hypothetical protein
MVRNLLMTAVALSAMTAVVAAGYVLPPPAPPPPVDEPYVLPPCLVAETDEAAMIRRLPLPQGTTEAT